MSTFLKYRSSPYPTARLTMGDPDSHSPIILVMDIDEPPGYTFYGPTDTLPNGMNAREWVRLAASHRRRELRPGAEGALPEPW
jgi:hypothetical protein